MENQDRLKFAIKHVTDKSVFIVDISEWDRLVDESGKPTKFSTVPLPITALMTMAANVMTAGSGIFNPNPGIDVVRLDPTDSPNIYNIDHYTVFEHFSNSPIYPDALRVAGIIDCSELTEFINSHVFIVGPYQEDIHHVPEIPEQIRNAKLKQVHEPK